MDHNTSSPSSAQIAAMSAKIMIATVIIVFLLMLFLFCIHIYFRCFYCPAYEDAHIVSWRRREARRSRTPAAAASQARRRGLDPQALRSIPIKVYNPKDFKEGLECAVCLSEVTEGEKTRILPKCNHGFHVQCIDMWFHSHSTCPLCRNPIVAPPNQPLSNGVEGIGVSSSSSTDSSDDEDGDDLSYHSANEGQGMSEGSSSSSAVSRGGGGDELVIEIPMRELIEEEEGKSPVVTRLKSFKRLLSRGKRALIPSPRASSSGDNASNDQV